MSISTTATKPAFKHKSLPELELLYNPEFIQQPNPQWLEQSFWQEQKAILGGAPGRGTSLFIATEFGEAVWRHYQRGGLPGKLIHDSYFWLGLTKTRAWQEFALTMQLLNLGLPVPTPLMAGIKRRGLVYSADLITLRLPAAVPLNDCLTADFDAELLAAVGACVARFHAAGLNHTDLNPRNILVNPNTLKVWLIDFDRCFLGSPSAQTAQQNLSRLLRAFKKLDPKLSSKWLEALMHGYKKAN